MRPPPGTNRMRKGLSCRLLKSLYGLKQSGRLWNKNELEFFTSIGFERLNGDASIMSRHEDEEISMVSIYVDDFLIASKKVDTVQSIKADLSKEYNVKDLGETKVIIGWQVTRDIEKGTLKIEQSAYVGYLLEEDRTDCKSVNIPTKAGSTIDMGEPDDYEEADLTLYQRLIGKLMYLSCRSHPDIGFAVGQLSRHNADPRVGHVRAAKRVVQYPKGTMHLGLTYDQRVIGQIFEERESLSPWGFIGYADSNFAGDPEDRKISHGVLHLYGRCPCFAVKQKITHRFYNYY